MNEHYSENGTCCICGGEYTNYGCNPDPVVIDSSGALRCCLKCNWEEVIPARIAMDRAERSEKTA